MDGGPEDRRVNAIRWLFPSTEGRLSPLDQPSLILGREEGVAIRLPGEKTSRTHAKIILQGLTIRIADLDSRNGVYVDGRKVKEAYLRVGSLLRIGDWIGLLVSVPGTEIDDPEPFRPVVPGYFAGPTLRRVLEPARKAATSDLPAIVQGETGTGKEGVAGALHAWSGRQGPFVAVNCAALPEALAEGELFGYRRGAFTGAERASLGYLRAAHGGTLFLDEVADLPPALQPKLLRALEKREVVPLGEATPVPIDVRIVVAVQSPLRDAVAMKRFRGDLYARLDGITLVLPPLRRRVEEIPFLFMSLLRQRVAGLSVPEVDAALIERLCLYDWPFNIRELHLVVRQLLALHGSSQVLGRSMLPDRLKTTEEAGSKPATLEAGAATGLLTMEAFVAALKIHHGNVTHTAAFLGISRARAYRMMETLPDLDVEQLRRGSADPPIGDTD